MSSSNYWRQREADQLAKNILDEAQYTKAINDYYDYMLDQAQKEIAGFYARYAKAEGISLADAKKRVSQLDMDAYERKAAKYVKNKTFTAEANEEMRLYNATMKINRLELLKANIGLELVDGFDDLQKYFDQILTDRTLSEFSRQSGILGSSIANSTEAAHAIVNASFHNAKFSDRIWMYQDMLKSELSKLLRQGLIQGKHPNELARHLQKLFGVSKEDALVLMRTELARVQIEAQRQSYERNGYEDYVFIAEPTACKKLCAPLDNGKPLKVKDMMPGTNAPPIHPNCRCSTAAYMDREEFDKWLNAQQKAGEIRAEAEKNEPGITKLLKQLANNTGSELAGLEHRLKTQGSLSRKIMTEPDKKVRDALRYTYLLEPDSYTEKYKEIVEQLAKKGYTISAVKNFWNNNRNPYNGLNTNVISDGNYEFELQYHTAESLEIKEEMHKLYEAQRLIKDVYSKEYAELSDKMFELSKSMTMPEGISEVQ